MGIDLKFTLKRVRKSTHTIIESVSKAQIQFPCYSKLQIQINRTFHSILLPLIGGL
jgi:hypothetical protein